MKIWPICRKNREMSEPEVRELLRKGDWGVLATVDVDGSPYGVPLNYAFDEPAGTLVFHGAREGRKWTWSCPEPEACFTVVAKSEILAGQFTTAYASVMVFGTLSRVDDEALALKALRLLAGRCQPDGADIEKYLTQARERTAVVLLKIQAISGKRRERR